MSFSHFFGMLTLSLIIPFPALAAAKDVPMPTISSSAPSSGVTIDYLSNGLAVAVKKDSRFPLASLRLYVHAGSAYETPDQAGISHQLEHMVFKGTENRPKGAIAADVEKAGGYLNAATSFDYTVYLTDMPSAEWKLGLDVLKDMAFHPSLDKDELESEKDVVLAELKRGEDSPSDRLFKRVQSNVLAGTPYGCPIIGFPETIKNFTAEGMRDYIKRLYQPQSMLLLVVGDVDPKAVLAEAEKAFGSIANTGLATPPKTLLPEDFPPQSSRVALEKTPWNKVHLSIAFPGVHQGDARAPVLDVYSQLLGGDSSSYLYQTYKYKKRLVDSISVASYSFERTGLFTINATLAPEKLGEFWEAFTKDLAKLSAKKFTRQEMDRAKLAVMDTLYRQQETVAGTASSLGYFLFFSGGVDGETNYLQQIDMVDQKSVAKAAAAVLVPERLTVTAFVPKKIIPRCGKPQKKTASGIASIPDAKWIETALNAVWPSPNISAASTSEKAKQPEREVIDLGKGRTLILLPDASMPYAAVDLIFTGGDSLLAANQQGLSSLAASVLTRGTKKMDAVKLEAFKNDRASSLAASSGRETFKISVDYPSRFEADMWGLLQDTLSSATWPDQEFARSKENQIAAIISREDTPLGLAFRRLFPFLFNDQLYGFQPQGIREGVAAFTKKDVASFWQKQSRQPWVLSICGSFDREAVIKAARALPAPQDASPKIAVPVWTKEKELAVSMPDRNQAHLMLVFPGVPAGHEDEAGLSLLQNILAGQSGLLFRDLRDKQGLGYTVTAFPWQAPLTGSVIFYIGTEPGKIPVAKAGFEKVIQELHENALPEEELTRGKNQMEDDYIRARQKMSARSSEAAALAILGRDLDADKKLVNKAKTLTANDLKAITEKYLVPGNAYTVIVKP
jgi:zinc protease